VGGVGGQASGHQGIVEELEHGAVTLDEDLRWSATRSALAVAKPDDAQRWLAAAAYRGRREVSGSNRSARQWGGASSAWTRRRRLQTMLLEWPTFNAWCHCVRSVRGIDMPHAL
jgi:hypothetical protein